MGLTLVGRRVLDLCSLRILVHFSMLEETEQRDALLCAELSIAANIFGDLKTKELVAE